MSDIRDKLKGLLNKPGLMTGSDWKARVDKMAEERAAGTYEVDKTIAGEIVENESGQFYRVRHDFPLDTRQGPVALGDALTSSAAHIAFSACDDELADFDPARTAFMDTETGGLVGGAGNVAFLIGVGYFVDDVFRLDQCFMRDYDDEEAMLAYLRELFRGMDTVVSYNGKTFDLPLLRSRFIQNRIPFPLDAAMHFDLLHAARRFWKRRLQNCTLGNIEREILGIVRQGDVHSALIPQLWFDYLRSRDARPLEPVFYHHKMDIVSLVALTAWVSRTLDHAAEQGFEHAEDSLSIARIHFRQKRYEDAIQFARRALESESDEVVRRDIVETWALSCKKAGQYDEMEEAWLFYAREYPQDLLPRLELAKHFEHRKRDIVAAAQVCEEAIAFLETRIAMGRGLGAEAGHIEELQHRLSRLTKKAARLAPPETDTDT